MPTLPGIQVEPPSRTRWFAANACVTWSRDGERGEVFVGGRLLGGFGRADAPARNALLVTLTRDGSVHFGRLAGAFDVSDELIRLVRRTYEGGGLEAVLVTGRRGAPLRLHGKHLRQAERLFARGASLGQVQAALAPAVRIGRTALHEARLRWRAAQRPLVEAAPEVGHLDGGASAPAASPVGAVSAPATLPAAAGETASVGAAEVTSASGDLATEASPADERDGSVEIADAPARSGRSVENLGAWILVAATHALGLYAVAERLRAAPREGAVSRPRSATVRVALDAFILALGVGERCVEGVRRLATATGGVLLRASHVPSPQWLRRVFGRLAADGTATGVHLALAGVFMRAARDAAGDAPTVFYVDNHLRTYSGDHVVRKGWRMQDRQVVPGITDCYVHDLDGRAVLRIDTPEHASLTQLLGRVTMLLRAGLKDERILVAFDRAGAFPSQLAELRDTGFDFVTYERRPYARLPEESFTERLELADGEVLRWCETRQKNLGAGRGRVRRITVRDDDGRQINLVAISQQPAEWLIGVMRGRWRQENAFKHAGQRWGQDQLDSRAVEEYPSDTIVPNPARRRLDHALRLARVREGDARRLLARLPDGDPRQARHEKDLRQAIAAQEELEAQRPHVPEHAPLEQTELAGKLVRHLPSYKLLLDAVRNACANAEADLAVVLAKHMKRPREAKRLLANLFAAPGDVRAGTRTITLRLRCAGTRHERRAVAAMLAELTARRLTLPGDPRRRVLSLGLQPFPD